MIVNLVLDEEKLRALPEACRFTSEKTGRSYLRLTVETFERTDNYGNDANAYGNIPFKDENGGQHYDKAYCGNGRTVRAKKENAAKPDTTKAPC